MADSVEGYRRALLIGVNHYYLDETIGNLPYCVNDVVDLDAILSDELRGNFSSKLLHSEMDNVKDRPTRNNIMSYTKLIANNSESNDSILFYFAGHGFKEDDVNYLLPADSCHNVLSDSAIPFNWIKETLKESLARKKFIIIDACHSGSKIGRSNSIPMSKSFHEEMFLKAEGFAVLSSCKFGQLSYDYPEKNHGAFSYFLLEGLKGSADNDGDGIITVPDANNYVSKKMVEWSMSKRFQQNPTFDYNVTGDFVFVRIPVQDKSELNESAVTIEAPQSEYIISKTLSDLSFTSYSEVYSKFPEIDKLRNYLFFENRVEKGKTFLTTLTRTRFSTSKTKEFLMQISEDITNIEEIKRWLGTEPKIKEFLILEFLTSNSFEYAGTMAHIMANLLPTLSDDDLLEIISGIEENGQISLSFKARSYLVSIIDASKGIIPKQRYMQLKELLNI